MPSCDPGRLALFAVATGDRNPLHVDPAYARAAGFAANVVFGTLLVLEVLEQATALVTGRVHRVTATFRSPLLVGQDFLLEPSVRGQGRLETRVVAEGRLLATVRLETQAGAAEASSAEDCTFPVEAPRKARLEDVAASQQSTVTCAADRAALGALAPRALAAFGPDLLSLLATVTRHVGMICPGEAAILRSFDVTVESSGLQSPNGSASVVRVDRRFHIIEQLLAFPGARVRVVGGFRQPPPADLSWAAAETMTTPDEFSAVRALVVGGSRGLGQATTRLLVAGGATVLATSRSPDATALDVRDHEVRAAAMKLDVLATTPEDEARMLEFEPTHLLWFATPSISISTNPRWSWSQFEVYRAVYAEALEAFAHLLGPLHGLLVPSSSYVEVPPAGLAEYAAAKELGDRVADHLVGRGVVQQLERPRLPPVHTQQNNAAPGMSVPGLQSIEAAAKLLLESLRALTEERMH